MTNQDTHEPQAIARNGNIIITGWDAEYTPEAASELVGDIAIALKEARRQLAAIVEACAQGHTWNGGYNSPVGDKHTVYHCTREGCQGRKEEPGWLPFEPKQHIVPFSPTLRDCTGPGCDHCADEAFGDQLRRSLTDIGAVEFIGEALGGPPRSDQPTITAKKIGYQWTIDAAPAEIQAALDARTRNPWPTGKLEEETP